MIFIERQAQILSIKQENLFLSEIYLEHVFKIEDGYLMIGEEIIKIDPNYLVKFKKSIMKQSDANVKKVIFIF